MNKHLANEKFDERFPDADYVSIQSSNCVGLDGGFTLEKLEFIVEIMREMKAAEVEAAKAPLHLQAAKDATGKQTA